MRLLTRSDALPQISGLIYSKVAELLFIGLLLVFIYPFIFIISGTDPTIPIESQTETKIVYYLQLALPLFCLAIALMYRGLDLRLPVPIVIYAGVCLASSMWSVEPYDTFKQASLLFLYVLAITAVCQVLDIATFCRIIVKLLIFLMLASVVMAVAFPKYGIHQANDSLHQDDHIGRWRGVFAHKNQLGAAASISVFTFLFLPRLMNVSAGFRTLCIAAAIVCLISAQSAGSWIALLMLLVYYSLMGSVRTSRSAQMLIVFGVSALAFTAFSFFADDLLAVVGRDATFSGRTDIWRIVLEAIGQKPLFGYGYYAATVDFIRPLLVGAIGQAAVDAHNGYLDVMLGTGIVGLALLLFCISLVIVIGISRMETSAPERDFFMLLLSFPILGLLSSFFEVAAMSGVQDTLGALIFLSLAAVPLYLGIGRSADQ